MNHKSVRVIVLMFALVTYGFAAEKNPPATPPAQTLPKSTSGPSFMGDSDSRAYEERLKMGRETWNADHTHLTINAPTEEYKKWVWSIHIAPTRSTTITAPYEDEILEVTLGNPGAFSVQTPLNGSAGYFFLQPAGPALGMKSTLTIMLRSGLRVTFDVTVDVIEVAVVNVDLQVLGREKVDPWIQRRVAFELAKVDQVMKRRERELDFEAATRANSTLLKAIVIAHEISSLRRTNRNANVIFRSISKARIGQSIYLRFLIKNNSDKSYDFAKAQIDVVRKPTGFSSIFSSADETRQPLANQIDYIENPRIPAGEERYGVLSFRIPDEWKSGDIFDVTVYETGLQRNITIDNIDLSWD